MSRCVRTRALASAWALALACLSGFVITNVDAQQSTSWTIEPLSVRICASDVMKDGVTVIAGGYTGEVYRSPDEGVTWQKIWQHPALTDKIDMVFVDSRDAIFVAGDRQGIYRSINRGDTFELVWNEVAGDVPVGAYHDAMAETEDGTLYLGVVDQGNPGGRWILKSTDGGATWSHHAQLPGKHVHFVRYNPLTHWLYTDDEFSTLRSKDYGATWQEIAHRDTSGVKMGVVIRGNYVYLSTHTFAYQTSPSWHGRVYRFYDDGSTSVNLEMVFEEPPGYLGYDPKLFNVMRKSRDDRFLLLGDLSYKFDAEGHYKYHIWVSESGNSGTWSVLTEGTATADYKGYGWMSEKWSKDNWLFIGNNDPSGKSLRIRPPQQTGTTVKPKITASSTVYTTLSSSTILTTSSYAGTTTTQLASTSSYATSTSRGSTTATSASSSTYSTSSRTSTLITSSTKTTTVTTTTAYTTTLYSTTRAGTSTSKGFTTERVSESTLTSTSRIGTSFSTSTRTVRTSTSTYTSATTSTLKSTVTSTTRVGTATTTMVGYSTDTVVLVYTDRVDKIEVTRLEVRVTEISKFFDQVIATIQTTFRDLISVVQSFFDRVTEIQTVFHSDVVTENVQVWVIGQAANVNLYPGYNLIALPVVNNSFTASSLLQYIGQPARSIFMFDATIQEYVTYDRDLVDFGIPQPDFAIKPNVGYFVYTEDSTSFLVTGAYPGQRDIQLRQGYNLVGWTTNVASKAKSAFVDPSQGTVKAVFMFDTTTQQYVSYDQDLVDFGIPQPDFDILPAHGYFVHANGGLTLHYQD